MAFDRAASVDDALDRGVAWLLAQQASDGAWRSETYGSMRPGASLTAFTLYALGRLPSERREALRAKARKGVDFLRVGLAKKGYVAGADGTEDYPPYASAMLLLAAPRHQAALSVVERRQLVSFLVGAQLGASRGFTPSDLHHGGWDLVGTQLIQRQTSGTNVSVGRAVLEALRDVTDRESAASASGDATDGPANGDATADGGLAREFALAEVFARAQRWTLGCQNPDGGFLFSPSPVSDSNKTFEKEDNRPASYGSATADGLRCLLYSGMKASDEPAAKAIDWLARHGDVETVPGFADLPETLGWKESLRFYYGAALSETLRVFPAEAAEKRAAALGAALAACQKKDGSWRNDANRMREDDPLIATGLAVITLANLV